MLNWLQRKSRNLILASQLSGTHETIRKFNPIERAYILLYIALFLEPFVEEEHKLVELLNNPHSFSRDEVMDIYYRFEEMRNRALAQCEQLKGLVAEGIMPEKLQPHMALGLHSLNVLLATLAPALIHDGEENTRHVWSLLESAHSSLPDAIDRFIDVAETLADEGDFSMLSEMSFSSDSEWIETSKWVPDDYRERSLQV